MQARMNPPEQTMKFTRITVDRAQMGGVLCIRGLRIQAAADAPTLDELLAKISAMALDVLPDNHPGVDPSSLYLQITALREAEPVA
jgi:hypothetical protein